MPKKLVGAECCTSCTDLLSLFPWPKAVVKFIDYVGFPSAWWSPHHQLERCCKCPESIHPLLQSGCWDLGLAWGHLGPRLVSQPMLTSMQKNMEENWGRFRAIVREKAKFVMNKAMLVGKIRLYSYLYLSEQSCPTGGTGWEMTKIVLAACLGLVPKKTWVQNYLTQGVACDVGFSTVPFYSWLIFLYTENEKKIWLKSILLFIPRFSNIHVHPNE